MGNRSKPHLFIHIGPHKTGTTYIQNVFWHQRAAYERQGLLYPKTGLFRNNVGPRHRHLATQYDPQLWSALADEIHASGCRKALISCELFSVAMDTLMDAAPVLEQFNCHLIYAARDEAARIRSYFLQFKQNNFAWNRPHRYMRMDFPTWWQNGRPGLSAAAALDPWIALFGTDNVAMLDFDQSATTSLTSQICTLVDVPELTAPDGLRSNPSITPRTAHIGTTAARFGRLAGHLAYRFADKYERPTSAKAQDTIAGFDANGIRAFVAATNAHLFKHFPMLERVSRPK